MDGPNQPDNSDGSWQFKPGETVSPRTATAPPPPDTASDQPAAATQDSPPVTVEQSQPMPAPAPEVIAPHSVSVPPVGPDGSITWTASEFVAHNKSPGWYLALAGAAVLIAAIIWLLTKDTISAIVVLVAALAFGMFAARQPRQLQYSLDDSGLTIGPRHFVYQQFRSFAIVPEGAFASIVFVPLKRFAPLTTIYYDPADEAKIVDLLSDRLPHEERQRDLIDRLMWRIRF